MAKATRIKYQPRRCKARGCSNLFIPTRKDHRYCSRTCQNYEAVAKWRKEQAQ